MDSEFVDILDTGPAGLSEFLAGLGIQSISDWVHYWGSSGLFLTAVEKSITGSEDQLNAMVAYNRATKWAAHEQSLLATTVAFNQGQAKA